VNGHRNVVDLGRPLLRTRGVCKSYPGVIAVDSVDFTLMAGQVHGLVGANGAGKSSFTKILSGAVRPDSGQIYFDGKEIGLRSPREGLDLGIVGIHQELAMVPEMSVLSNVFLGNPISRGILIDRVAMAKRFREMSKTFSLSIPEGIPVRKLSVAARQKVEILRAIQAGCEVLIMDEPTATLDPPDRQALFDLSVAAAYSFTAVVAAVVGRSFDPAIAFASAVAAGVCFGIINGSLIAVVKLNPFITTVGTGFMLNGLALLLTDNAAISVDNPDFGWLGAAKTFGIPDSGILLIGTYALLETILRRTTYGEAVYAVGGNYEASWFSGLPVRFVIASTYVLFGACCGLAASITASQLESAQANIDSGMIFDVLTIVVVGGTSLAGGSGSVWRTAIGLGIIATMSSGFVLLGISPYYQDIIKGMIIVAALAMSATLRRSR
jgi:ribose transport system permease protein